MHTSMVRVDRELLVIGEIVLTHTGFSKLMVFSRRKE